MKKKLSSVRLENPSLTSEQKAKEYRRSRIRHISRNFFLHIHSPLIDSHSLKPSYSLGLGIFSAFLFLILIFTGIILMFYYTPSVENAYNSVKDIVFIVPGGRIIRNIHRWSAHALVLLTFFHMLRVFFTGSYHNIRSTNWIIGVAMLITVMLMNFSGYLLPWDQLGYWAITIGSNIAASPQELTDLLGITNSFDPGSFFKKLLIGDNEIGQPALSRFFALHVFLLPLTLLILTAVHIWRIRKDGGLSKSAGNNSGSDKEKWYTWPLMQWIELAALLALIFSLLMIAIFVDAPLLEKADPANPENPAKSPWYFLGIQEMVSYSAFTGGIIVPLLFVVFLVSLPFFDKEEKFTGHWFSGREGRRIALRSFFIAFISVVFILWIYIDIGWLRDFLPGISQGWVMIINPATLITVLFIFYSARISRQTQSKRMAAIALFTASVTGLIILTIVGIWFRGPNWDFYWSSSQWPVF